MPPATRCCSVCFCVPHAGGEKPELCVPYLQSVITHHVLVLKEMAAVYGMGESRGVHV